MPYRNHDAAELAEAEVLQLFDGHEAIASDKYYAQVRKGHHAQDVLCFCSCGGRIVPFFACLMSDYSPTHSSGFMESWVFACIECGWGHRPWDRADADPALTHVRAGEWHD